MKSELQVLQETRELIATRWTSGSNSKPDYLDGTHYCLVGAINKATNVPIETCSAVDVLPFWVRNRKVRELILDKIEDKTNAVNIEVWNDRVGPRMVLQVLDSLIAELEEPKSMEIGTPEKEYTIEPAEPVPGIKESPAPTPEPRREPAKPEREKVPA